MKKVDFLVVGCGLAGLAFCEQLRKRGKTFHVIDKQSFNASRIASGLYNPVVLKRLNFIWKGKEQMELADSFYKELESLLKIKVDQKLDILRIIHSNEEKNDWLVAADKPNLKDYLTIPFIDNNFKEISAPFGFGRMIKTGKIDTDTLLESYIHYLKSYKLFTEEEFDYNLLEINSNYFKYSDIQSNRIVFSEGFGIKNNPFFNKETVNGTKGELLLINCPSLKLTEIIKSSVFIIPLGGDNYLVGSTYNWDDESWHPTIQAKEEIISKLNEFLIGDYTVIDHFAGIRPTTKDRRPVIGEHPEHKNMYVINGLGTRGVLLAPFIARLLYGYIFEAQPIEKEIGYERFL